MATIRVTSGSTRAASLNQRLARLTVDMLRAYRRDATYLDLEDYPMPLYHGDLEASAGPPDAARRLHDDLAVAGGVVIVGPEYNGAMTPLLKNTLDWVSRVERGVLRDRVVGLMGASPGSRGARHGLDLTATWLRYMGAAVLDEPFSLPRASEAFVTSDAAALAPREAERLGRWLEGFLTAVDDAAASAGTDQ